MYEKILYHLKDLDNSSGDIESSALVSVDGLVMATTLPSHIDIDYLGAISAGAFLLGHHTSQGCAIGMLEQVLITYTESQIVMTQAGSEAILTVFTKPYADIEQLFSNIQYSVEKITAII